MGLLRWQGGFSNALGFHNGSSASAMAALYHILTIKLSNQHIHGKENPISLEDQLLIDVIHRNTQ